MQFHQKQRVENFVGKKCSFSFWGFKCKKIIDREDIKKILSSKIQDKRPISDFEKAFGKIFPICFDCYIDFFKMTPPEWEFISFFSDDDFGKLQKNGGTAKINYGNE